MLLFQILKKKSLDRFLKAITTQTMSINLPNKKIPPIKTLCQESFGKEKITLEHRTMNY
jgi:hypothetical protein